MADKKLKKPTIEEIRKVREELVGKEGGGGYYSSLRAEQITDQEYYDDEFSVNIRKPYHIIRTGTAARIVDNITDHIDTSNPQAFRKPRKRNTTEDERAAKIARLLNHWLPRLIDEIEETLKNANRRGEAFVQVEYNENFDPDDDDSLPIIPSAPDPMIIYSDPHEYMGIPRQVIKSCKMSVGAVRQVFPKFSNPKHRRLDKNEGVDYWFWWDKDWRYGEADGEPLLSQGIQENILGFVPFVHCYSGFGKRSPSGRPEDRAVGRLRKVRGRLKEECEVESRLDSIIGLYANPIVVGKALTNDTEKPEGWDELDFSPGHNIWLDYGVDYEIKSADPSLIQPLVYHLSQIRAALGVETPSVSMGMPSTSRATGRQEDIYVEQYGRKYRKLIQNVEKMWATALGMGLRILYNIPALLPITVRATMLKDGKPVNQEETIEKTDIGRYYDCTVELRAEDEITTDRKVQLGRLLINEGRIDWRTFLTEYVGWTEDKAEEVITQTLVDQAIFSPQFINITIKEALEKLGMQKHIEELEAKAAEQQQMQQQLQGMGKAKFRPSEARNPEAAQVIRQLLEGQGVRNTSAGYEQGVVR